MKKLTKKHSPIVDKPFSSINVKSVHFVGILGIGVSSLAQWFMVQNWSVSGSDVASNPILAELKKAGIKAKIGHKKANLGAETDLVIYNQAIPVGNAELKEAKKTGIPILSYPQAIGKLTKKYKTIAVAGAHGKGTTTAFLSLILIQA